MTAADLDKTRLERRTPWGRRAAGTRCSGGTSGETVLRRLKPPAQTRHIGDIDALRAFAMTAVIAQHCKVFPPGWTGVWLFFVISGFVVTTALLSRPNDAPGPLLAHFYARRAARILPIYLLYTVLAFAVSAALSGPQWAPFASLVLFYNNFQAAFGVGGFRAFPVGHLWTISVEMQFYLFYGLAFAVLPRRALTTVLVGLLGLAPLLRLIGGLWLSHAGVSPLRSAFAIYAFSPMHFDSFALGALLALGLTWWSEPRRASALFAAGALALGAYVLAYAAINFMHGARGAGVARNIVSGILFGQERQVWLYSALATLCAGVVALTATGRAPWTGLLRRPWLQAVGRVSYGGYVYHALVIVLVSHALGPLMPASATQAAKLAFGAARLAVSLPLTVALAFASYRFVELPIMRRAA